MDVDIYVCVCARASKKWNVATEPLGSVIDPGGVPEKPKCLLSLAYIHSYMTSQRDL